MMYGGNNFNRNPYHSNNASFNQYSKQKGDQRMGSFRLHDYHTDRLTRNVGTEVQAFKGKNQLPSSICSRLETLNVAPTQLRIEDYYLIREEKAGQHVVDKVKDAVKKNCFNPEIAQRKMDKPKSANIGVFKDADQLNDFMKKRRSNHNVGLNWAGSSPKDNSKDKKGSYEGRSNNIFGNNSSNNIVSRNGQGYAGSSGSSGSSGGNNPQNVFMNTRTQGGGLFDNHPGGSNGTSGGGSGGGNQIFSKGYGGTGMGGNDNNRMSNGIGSGNSGNSSGANGMFGKSGQGTGVGTSGNIFSQQNTGSSSNQGGNKIFGNTNTGGSNTSANIFGNSSSNNSGSNNNNGSANNNKGIFGGNNQNQSSSNQTNIFGKSQNSNQNNNQNNNKIFTNTSNNNNVFNNNQNNNNNSLFNNNQNNNNNNQGKPSMPPQFNQFISHMSGIMQETQLMMLNIVSNQHQQLEEERKAEREEETLFQHENPLNKMFQFEEDEDFLQNRKKDRAQNQIFIMQPTPKMIKHSTYNRVERYPREEQRSKLGKTAHSRLRQETQHVPNMRSQTIRQGSNHFSQRGMSYKMGNTCKDGSIAHGQTIDLNKKLTCQHPCKVDLEFQINWIIKESERIELPKLLKETIELDSVDLETEEGREEICRVLKERKELGIRNDAVIKIDKKRCAMRNVLIISGKIEQKLINIGEDYDYFFNGEKNGKLQGFTIRKENMGSIAWDYSIPYLNLDFQKGNDFNIEDNEFQVELPELKGPCRITFFTLPRDINQIRNKRGTDEARSALRSRINRMDGGMQFLDLWESGSWCFKFPRGIE